MSIPGISPDVVTRPAAAPRSGYRFLTVDAMTRRVTNEFQFSDVAYSFERNAPGEFAASCDLYSPDTKFLIPQSTYIVVERAGIPFWVGFLWQPTRNEKRLTVNAQGILSVFGHRHIRESKTYITTDRAAIVRDLITYGQQGLGGDLGISVGSELLGGTTLSHAVNWWDNKNILEVIGEIVAINPSFTIRIDGSWLPGNKLALSLVIDTVYPRPTPHRLIYGGNVSTYEAVPLSPSPNHVDAFGGFDAAAMIRRSVQNTEALGFQPRIESTVENRDILFATTVESLARNTLKNQSGSPVQPTVQMVASASPVLGELMPGQQAQVLIDDGPYIHVNGTYTLSKLSVSVPDGAADSLGAELVAMEFESIVADTSVSVVS